MSVYQRVICCLLRILHGQTTERSHQCPHLLQGDVIMSESQAWHWRIRCSNLVNAIHVYPLIWVNMG